MQDEARQVGSEGRYIDLVLSEAVTLRQAGRTQEALQRVDDLLAYITTQGRRAPKKTAAAVKAMRRALASSRLT